jgi:hypothetical protein
MRIALASLMIVLATSFSYAGTCDPSVPEARCVEYGKDFVHVIMIKGLCGCRGKESHEFKASAVIIAPHWIITAAHVVNNAHDVVVLVSGKEYKINGIKVHEDFKDENVGLGDIALGHCDEDFGMDFYPEMYDGEEETGKVVSICGYGLSGNFSTGSSKSDETRRAGSNIIDRVERNCLICTNIGGKKTSLEFMIASGDSGGGLFLDGKLAGVNSFVMADDGKLDSDYGDESGHTRISVYSEWIKTKMNSAD